MNFTQRLFAVFLAIGLITMTPQESFSWDPPPPPPMDTDAHSDDDAGDGFPADDAGGSDVLEEDGDGIDEIESDARAEANRPSDKTNRKSWKHFTLGATIGGGGDQHGHYNWEIGPAMQGYHLIDGNFVLDARGHGALTIGGTDAPHVNPVAEAYAEYNDVELPERSAVNIGIDSDIKVGLGGQIGDTDDTFAWRFMATPGLTIIKHNNMAPQDTMSMNLGVDTGPRFRVGNEMIIALNAYAEAKLNLDAIGDNTVFQEDYGTIYPLGVRPSLIWGDDDLSVRADLYLQHTVVGQGEMGQRLNAGGRVMGNYGNFGFGLGVDVSHIHDRDTKNLHIGSLANGELLNTATVAVPTHEYLRNGPTGDATPVKVQATVGYSF